jgi:hypothetical protein
MSCGRIMGNGSNTIVDSGRIRSLLRKRLRPDLIFKINPGIVDLLPLTGSNTQDRGQYKERTAAGAPVVALLVVVEVVEADVVDHCLGASCLAVLNILGTAG